MNNESNETPVNTEGARTVYAIPARPKPKAPWWANNFGALIVIWGCVVLAILIMVGE